MRRTSTSNGCRSLRSVESGLRPSASDTLLLAPVNFPLGDAQGSSANRLELIFSMVARDSRAVAAFDIEHRARNGNINSLISQSVGNRDAQPTRTSRDEGNLARQVF